MHGAKNLEETVIMAAIKKFGNLQAGRVAFFLCDMQEKFRPAIFGFEDIVTVSKRLVRAILPPFFLGLFAAWSLALRLRVVK